MKKLRKLQSGSAVRGDQGVAPRTRGSAPHWPAALFCLILSVAVASAAVDGVVVNKTTGKPQPGTPILLMKIGAGGMQPAGNTKGDAQGRFHFDENLDGPHLLQATYEGVTYNRMLPPGMPANNVEVEVYNASKKVPEAKLAQHIMFLEPGNGQLTVNESFFFNNTGNVTLQDLDAGTFRLYLPEGVEPRVNATAPQGMPVQRTAEKTSEKNVYKVEFAIKPGETRFDVAYVVPFSGAGSFAGKLLYKDAQTRIAVPQGVTLKGEGVTALGQEPSTNAAIFGVNSAEYKLDIEGTGSLQAAATQDAGSDEGPQISQILPRVYDNMPWIVAFMLAALALGFVLLYRRGSAGGAAAGAAASSNQPVQTGSKRRG